jgi:hypothetical protein
MEANAFATIGLSLKLYIKKKALDYTQLNHSIQLYPKFLQ